MARGARIVLPDVPMHVIQRGNNKQPCFLVDSDRARFVRIIQQHIEASGCAVHAYVLMTNHIHLLLTPPSSTALSDLMKSALQEYTQYFNLKYQRTGGLWEGRFRSALVQTEDYFLICQRYIELNPVRAHMVARPADHRWSSYRCNAHGMTDPLVTPHALYLGLHVSDDKRREIYQSLCNTAIDQPILEHIRQAVRGNGGFGSAAFTEQIANRCGRKLPGRHVGRPPG